MSNQRRLSELEFIALTAMLFAIIAFSIDAMLPAMTAMATELSPESPEQITLVIGMFIVGMGVGTLFAGSLSDAFGRKPVILTGYGIYIVGALIAALAQSLEGLLLGRFIQGLAVAGPRIAALAMVRDLYKGERMAAVSSFSMMIFVLVPAVAPLIGKTIMDAYGWRAIFLAFVGFALLIGSWMAIRQPETHPKERRVPLSISALGAAVRECFDNRVFRFSVTVLTLTFACLYILISAIQPIYAVSFQAEESFPYWFAGAAILALPGNFANGRLVTRFGMRYLIKTSMACHFVVTAVCFLALMLDSLPIWGFFIWTTSFMFFLSFMIANLTALSLEPMGHIAGLAASVNGAVSTIAAAVLAMPFGLAFDGTPRAAFIGVIVFLAGGYLLMQRLGPRPQPNET